MNIAVAKRDISIDALIGTWRRFGQSGPAYEIVGDAIQQGSHDKALRVRVPTTGEEIDYPLADILRDPQEA